MALEETQIIFNVIILIVLIITLMVVAASHRMLKTHQYYLQALIEHEILEDIAKEQTGTTGSNSTLKGSGALRRSQGEMCNDLRSPMGGKIYNRDCLTTSMTGSAAAKNESSQQAKFPNINTMIQKDYYKSGQSE